MNGLSLFALVVAVLAVVVAYRYGRRAARDASVARDATPRGGADADAAPRGGADADAAPRSVADADATTRGMADADTTTRNDALLLAAAEAWQLRAFAEERRALFAELARVRGELARYRQLVVDLENDAPPPILGERGTPDDLKLIVGIGPILERMLQQLGIATYRQIARWNERDIDAMDARLPEFPGRIRRDAWVTQARALHQSKYGDAP